MKNIKLIRTAVMLVLVSSVFIFAACAKEEGGKITDKDIAGTTWTAVQNGIQFKFNKNKTFNADDEGEIIKGSWKISKIKVEDYVAARMGLGNPEDMMDNTKTGKNTSVYIVTIKYKNSNETETGEFIATDKFFNGWWVSDKNFFLVDYEDFQDLENYIICLIKND
ncbi:MAG: hypothetical protein K6G00_04175 [Treponema sp.]|nr:hypothetical protein [Treponema sp.]